MITLAFDDEGVPTTIELSSDLLWTDEFDWSPVAQQETITLTGVVLIEEDAQLTGRRISLEGGPTYGYVQKSVVSEVQALADIPGQVMTLTLNNNGTFPVIFTGKRCVAKPVIPYNNPGATDYYTLSLYLMVWEE